MADTYPKRKEIGEYFDITGEPQKEKFRESLEALRTVRRAFYPDDQWNKLPIASKYRFLDTVDEILTHPGLYAGDPDYKKIKTALAKDESRNPNIEEGVLQAVRLLERRRGSADELEEMNEIELTRRTQARDVKTYWNPLGRKKTPLPSTPSVSPVSPSPPEERRKPIALLPSASSFTLRVDSEPVRGITFSLIIPEHREVVSAFGTFTTGEIEGERFITTKDLELTPGQYTIEMPWQYERDNKAYYFQHWEDNSTEPTRTINLVRDTKITATYKVVEKAQPQKEVCPDEVMKVGRWLVRKMPETAFDILLPVFLRQPQIIRLIRLGPDKGGITQEQARSCFWRIYREFYQEELSLKGSDAEHWWDRKIHPTSGRQLFRKGIGYKVPKRGLFDTEGGGTPRYKMLGDPLLRSAINRGKRVIRKSARAYYVEVLKGADQRLDEVKKELDTAKREHKSAEDTFKKLREEESKALKSMSGEIKAPVEGVPVGAAGKVEFQERRAALEEAKIILQEAKEKLDKVSKEAEELERTYDPRNFYNVMLGVLNPIVEAQSTGLAAALAKGGGTEYWRYGESRYENAGLNADIIRGELQKEADYLARYYGRRMQRRIKTKLPSLLLGMRNISFGAQTGGEAWTQLLHNLWNFVFGPWTIGTAFVLVQFFFVLTYVGYSVQILWVMPIIAAVITFIFNFSDSMRPFDWITHLASGAMIGYSAALFLIALGVHNWSTLGIEGTSSIGFWIAWALLGFIGLFQFYQTGGFKVVLQGSIIILLFAYLALGPYQAYFHQAVDQVKAPVEIAYRAVSNAVTDVWLLATNPTEWYARQQVVNVRPERPLDFPKGVELSTIEALPASVPAGQQFALTTVIKNDGVLDQATDIMLSVYCDNQWCDSSQAKPNPIATPDDDARERLGILAKDIENGKIFYVSTGLKRSESAILTVQPFTANYLTMRAAETNFARIKFNLSYMYTTNSSLQVSVISEGELNRRFREGETVFKGVTAVSKGTPAQLSLNVGPQPLKNGTKSLLLVSVSNTRDNSKIILRRDDKIIIKMPHSIGNGLNCNGFVEDSTVLDDNDENVETVVYKIRPTEPAANTIEILPYEFRSIFAFLCTFTAAEAVETTRTDLVTASLPQYIFRLEQKKDVPITPPLGIIYEPFEQVCNKAKDATACYQITDTQGKRGDPRQTCYYEHAGETITRLFGSPCRVCGSVPNDCGKFLHQDTCSEASKICGWSCRWNENAKHMISGVEIGTCEKVEVTGGPSATGGGAGLACTDVCAGITGSNSDYNAKLLIDSSGVPVDKDAVGAVMYSESRCKQYLDSGNVKCSDANAIGLMQLIPGTAANPDVLGDAKLACDPQQNVVGGALNI